MARKKGVPNKPKDVTENMTFGKTAIKVNEQAKISSEAILEHNEGITKAEDGTIVTTPEFVPPENILPEKVFLLHNYNFTDLVRDIMYLGRLGAKLTPKKLPKLTGTPYSVSLTIKGEDYVRYQNKEDEVHWSSTLDYNKTNISNYDAIGFVNSLLEVGKKQAVIPDKKVAMSSKPYRVTVYTKVPVEGNFNVVPVPRKPLKYTKEQLDSMEMNELKLIGKHYEVTSRSKENIIESILKAQTGE